jgi:type IV pilus assembly protein PilY1
MNTKPQAPRRPGTAAIWLLGTMLSVWMLGAIYTPAMAATSTTVSVDQQPVTVQPTIPPNVTLMLDDSGSMAEDYMPDACYLYGVACGPTITSSRHGTTSSCNNGTSPINNVGSGTGQCVDTITSINNQAVIDANNNGVYYNPTVVYTPPPTANGGVYTSQTNFTSVPLDGFGAVNGTANLTNYSNNDLTGENNSDSGMLYYSTSSSQSVNNNFSQQVTSSSSHGSTTYADQVCTNDFNADSGNSGTLVFTGITNAGTTSKPKWTKGQCTFTYPSTATYYYFQYSTGAASGPYTTYYVAPASQGCGSQTNCVVDSDTNGTAAPAKDASGNSLAAGTNIANWFAYYHVRIQMAKSGLMTAFSTVDTTFRVGFGSIDNNGSSSITSLGNGLYKEFNNQYIAYVQPFGNGSSGTQKANFWNWVSSINPNNGTPLRQALDSVGQYYQTSQPWTTMSSDPGYGTPNQPSNIACRQSYTILTTDGFWNETNPPTTETGANNTAWPSISGPNGQSWPSVSGSMPGVPYSGGEPSSGPSLADVALYYWENDLQNNINFPNEVPRNTDDPAFWQHMVTFTMGLGFTPSGISGTASNGDSPPSISDIFSAADGNGTITGFGWPTPASNSLYNISDLAHAGVNGHGGFYSATNPSTFASGLTDALNRAAQRVGSGASLAANSTQLTNGTVAYQANYYTVQWAGDLKALSINSSTGAISTTPNWSASSMLTSGATVNSTNNSITTYPSRTIVTYVPSTSTTGAGTFVNFTDSNSTTPPALSSTQLTALGSSATAQAAMVSYLRGDNTLEKVNNGSFRTRSTPLGDIVDSQPVYAGAPDPNEFENQVFTGTSNTATSGDNSFEGFAVGTTNATTGVSTPSAASTRTSLVFVAANDGMLHAFDAGSGTEKYAYLPGAVITGDNTSSSTTIDSTALASVANVNYGSTTVTTNPHQYFNDGELTIADVYFSSAWHTVLVGTTGRGPAKAVYALDITNPSSITPLWERSAGDGGTNSGYIGQMVGKPVIAQVADGNWQVLIGNGYNSANGTAALLEFELDNGTLSVHTTDSTAANGLAAPVAWMDNSANGISTEAYAGDLAGRVWEFPLDVAKSVTSGTPPVTTITNTADLTAAGVLEFTATDPSGNAQPITGGMIAGRDPTTSNVWVFFGTGEYLSTGDLTNKQIQSWYGLIVQPGSNPSTLPSLPTTTLSGNLVQRYITYELDGNSTATPPTLGVRTVTTLPSPSDMTGKLGWYMNLEQPVNGTTSYNAQGERMVTPNQFEGNLLLGTTRIPAAAANADICNSSGSGWVMAVDPFTGTNPTGTFFSPNGGGGTVTITVGGKSVTVPVAGVGFSALPNNPIFVGSDMVTSFDNGTTSSLSTSGASGNPQRVSWQEVVNP